MVQSRWSILKRTELRGPGLLLLTFVAPIASEIRPHDSGRANLSSSISQLSITEALVLQCFPKIDPDFRIGEIELDALVEGIEGIPFPVGQSIYEALVVVARTEKWDNSKASGINQRGAMDTIAD